MKRAILLLLFLTASRAFGAFGYQAAVTIDHTKVPSTQTDFPVLISVTDSHFKTVGNGGHVENSNGYDIRPYSDTACSSAMTYELERYNGSTGEVVMWVKISSLSSSSDTVINLAYGDSGISTDGSSTSTWSNNFLAVLHAKDGTTLSLADSSTARTFNNHNGVTAGTGQIDGAASFASASSQSCEDGDGGAFGGAAETYSAWVKATTISGAEHTVIGRGFAGIDLDMVVVKANGKLRMQAWAFNGGGVLVSYDGTGSNTLSTGTWYYLTLTYDSSSGLKGYVNASVDNTAAANGAGNTTSQVATFIGGKRGTGCCYWNGQIDEVRSSSVVRSADWITTEYNNQSSPATFETLGSEQIGCPLASPTPTATATATSTPTVTPTATPSGTPTVTPTATPSELSYGYTGEPAITSP